MVYYIFLIFVSVIAVFFYELVEYKFLKFLIFLFLLITISILPGLRDVMVGSDTYTYVSIFQSKVDIFGGFEPGFNLLINFLQWMGFQHYSYYLIFFALLTNFFFLYSILSLSINKVTSVILFLSISTLYLFEFNVIRQSLAVSIFLFSLIFLVKEDYKKTIIIILLAILFHYSAIFLLIIPFLFYFFKEKLFILNVLSLIIVLLINLVFSGVLDFAISLTGREAVYANYSDVGTESGLRFVFLINTIIYLSLCISAIFFKKLKDINLYKIGLMLFSFLLAFNFSITFLGMKYEGVGRIMNYFFTAYFIAVPVLLKVVNIKYRVIFALLMIFFAVIYTLLLIDVTNINGIFPYKFSSLV